MKKVLSIHMKYTPCGHMAFIQRRFNVDATFWRCIDVTGTLYKTSCARWIYTWEQQKKKKKKKYRSTILIRMPLYDYK